MKMFCISDDLDIAVGLKLTGIKSVILDEKSKIDEKIDEMTTNILQKKINKFFAELSK